MKARTRRKFQLEQVPRRPVSYYVLFQYLLFAVASQLAHGQDTATPVPPFDEFSDDSLFDVNSTQSLFPTVIDPETNRPTNGPSTTFSPSYQPSASLGPSTSPTDQPTTTVSPSASPTTTFKPSSSPSVSPRPTVSAEPSAFPSHAPTNFPSSSPSAAPSPAPTISHEPTISDAPTISEAPTLSRAPSDSPSILPSDSPSGLPTVSPEPSNTPSVSNAPSVSPQPSLSPSVSPTELPSVTPTAFPTTPEPSEQPSDTPSDVPSTSPTSMPTLTVRTVVQPSVYMYLEGLPGLLTAKEISQWIEVTENHIWRYFDEVNDSVPGVLPVNVTRVYGTLLKRQEFDPGADGGLGGLELEYVQAIDYGLFDSDDVNEEVIQNQIFIIPFDYDAKSYIVDLIKAWELDTFIEFGSINVGPTNSPTIAPIAPPDSTPLSRAAIGSISACIVLSACLVVAFLFWDRHRKEKVYMQAHARDFETMEYDNAGQPIDWRNPYSPTAPTLNGSPSRSHGGGSPPAQDRAATTRSNSPQTTVSTVLAATPTGPADSSGQSGSSKHSRGGSSRTGSSIPGIPRIPGRQGQSMGTNNFRSSSGGSGGQVFGMPSNDHSRRISDVTDLTSSDFAGGRSDRGSDGLPDGANMLATLPTISDERYGHGTPWSPVYIAEEDYVTSGSQDEESNVASPRGDMNKLGNSMSGFQMEVQDLE